MSPRVLLMAALPLALAACATTNSPVSKAKPQQVPAQAAKPAQTAHVQKPKASPYAAAQEDPGKRGDYVAGGLFQPGVADTVPEYIPDVDAIPEPEVRIEPRARTGNRSYSVLGRRYNVMDSEHGYVEEGGASYYGKKFHGRRTSSGEVYDMYAFTAAHKNLPLPSYARVTNLDNGKSVVVRVNDRGPFHDKRIIDLSYAAAVKLDYRERGVARVEVRALTPEEAGTLAADARKPVDATAMDQLVGQLPQAVAVATTAPATAPSDAAAPSYRFDMHQNGRVMTADEFDAWMQTRRVRVATGKPGKPDPVVGNAAAPAVAQAAATPAQVGATRSTVLPEAAASLPPAPGNAAAAVAVATAPGEEVVLQVASFANAKNAQHALALLQSASITRAQLFDADVNGKKIWRLRIGPVLAANAPELAARIVGLGFGQPQRVRD